MSKRIGFAIAGYSIELFYAACGRRMAIIFLQPFAKTHGGILAKADVFIEFNRLKII